MQVSHTEVEAAADLACCVNPRRTPLRIPWITHVYTDTDFSWRTGKEITWQKEQVIQMTMRRKSGRKDPFPLAMIQNKPLFMEANACTCLFAQSVFHICFHKND